ncbi:unnamed protein product [Arctogadus glacialis]
MTPLLSWIFVVLWTFLQEADGLTFFPDNAVFVAKAGAVSLTCDSATTGNVNWVFIPHGDVQKIPLKGTERRLEVAYEDTPQLGEYSCWSGETKLWSAHLVLDAQDTRADSMLNCSAKSYNCSFNCHWSDTYYTAVRLGLGKDCSENRKNCSWITSSSQQHTGQGFVFELSNSLTPSMEETTRIEVTAEAMNDYIFHRTYKTFFLRDIIRPESPKIVQCQEVGHQLNVSIEPAASWSKPHSYFKLEHEIEYVSRHNGKNIISQTHLIPREISKLRVRSRDAVVRSKWSEWSPWRNVRKPGTPKKRNSKNKCKPQRHNKDPPLEQN